MEGKVFENEILSRTESTDNPAQEMPEGHDHGKNLIGTSQIELLSEVTDNAGVPSFGE
jgi:hypothetical protein